MNSNNIHHQVIIVGAGPGGITVASALKEQGITDVLLIDKGSVGQAWLDYPAETHLLSESAESHDDNMIAGVKLAEVFPNIPHPSHIMYQRYLEEIVKDQKLEVASNLDVLCANYDSTTKLFTVETKQGTVFTCQFLVWAAGMYETPNETLEGQCCYIHYARVGDFDHITDQEVTVVGGANGASGVVMNLARPGRIVNLVISKTYDIPQPIDCLWKENMQFVKDLEMQGLVKITENFRVKKIAQAANGYELTSTEDQTMIVPHKPIICVGFLPNVEPIATMVDVHEEGHDWLLEIDDVHQSKKQPGLYVAGTLGKLKEDEGFIRHFRDFGKPIAESIKAQLKIVN